MRVYLVTHALPRTTTHTYTHTHTHTEREREREREKNTHTHKHTHIPIFPISTTPPTFLFTVNKTLQLITNPSLPLSLSSAACHRRERNAERRLFDYLMRNYDSGSRPVLNAEHSVKVNFSISLNKIHDLVSVWRAALVYNTFHDFSIRKESYGFNGNVKYCILDEYIQYLMSDHNRTTSYEEIHDFSPKKRISRFHAKENNMISCRKRNFVISALIPISWFQPIASPSWFLLMSEPIRAQSEKAISCFIHEENFNDLNQVSSQESRFVSVCLSVTLYGCLTDNELGDVCLSDDGEVILSVSIVWLAAISHETAATVAVLMVTVSCSSY